MEKIADIIIQTSGVAVPPESVSAAFEMCNRDFGQTTRGNLNRIMRFLSFVEKVLRRDMSAKLKVMAVRTICIVIVDHFGLVQLPLMKDYGNRVIAKYHLRLTRNLREKIYEIATGRPLPSSLQEMQAIWDKTIKFPKAQEEEEAAPALADASSASAGVPALAADASSAARAAAAAGYLYPTEADQYWGNSVGPRPGSDGEEVEPIEVILNLRGLNVGVDFKEPLVLPRSSLGDDVKLAVKLRFDDLNVEYPDPETWQLYHFGEPFKGKWPLTDAVEDDEVIFELRIAAPADEDVSEGSDEEGEDDEEGEATEPRVDGDWSHFAITPEWLAEMLKGAEEDAVMLKVLHDALLAEERVDPPEDRRLERGDTVHAPDGTPYLYDPAAYPEDSDPDY